MVYKIKFQDIAKSDIHGIYQYFAGLSEYSAKKWHKLVWLEIDSLRTMPYRFAIAPESDDLHCELHQLFFGKRTTSYRIVYRIVEEQKEVRILTIRHASRQPLNIEDLE